MSDLEELKRLAQAATDDAWEARGEEVNAAFFVSATPAAVLALVERVERAEASRDDEVGELHRRILFLQSLLGAEKVERDALREQVSALMHRVEVAEAARSESVVRRGEDTVRVYELWKREPDGTVARRLECAECGHVFQQSQEEAK